MRQERHVNNAQTTLQGAIGSGTTSIVVADGSVFPSEGDFRIVIDFELMLVTARSGNTLTVVREIESTVAATHNDAADVKAVITEGALEQFWSDYKPLFIPDGPPPARIFNASGVPVGESGFTWANQGTATATDLSDGSILLHTPGGGGNNVIGKYVTPPSTPYTCTAAFAANWLMPGNYPQCGIFLENSGDGYVQAFSMHHRPYREVEVVHLTSYTSYSASGHARTGWGGYGEVFWLRFQDDGVDHKFALSVDGVNWLQFHSQTRTTWLSNGGDRIGWFHDRGSANRSEGFDTLVKAWSFS